MPARLASILALATASVACGGGVECAEGTFRQGENCVAFDPNDTTPPVITLDPPGRRSRDPIPSTLSLTTDELSQIYITTDGSDPDPTGPGEPSPVTVVDVTDGMTLKYFAVDRTGNQSALEMATYTSDTIAPARVGGLSITPGTNDAALSWTNPADPDFAGVIVARVTDVIDGAPEGGVTYAAPTALTTSLQIVHVGGPTTTQFVDTGLIPGAIRYVVWAFDDLGNYGEASAVRSQISLDTLEFELSLDSVNNTVTETTPSIALSTAGTTVTANGGGSFTVTLNLKNNSTTYFQNPKAEVVSTTNATFATTNPTADGLSFVDLGPATLAPNATVIKTITFTAVTGVATLRLKLGHHASMIVTRGSRTREVAFIDTGAIFLNNSVRETPRFTTVAAGPNGRSNARPALFVGQHFVDVPTSHGSIERWDTVTQSRVASVDINAQNADRTNIQALFADSANIYCLAKGGKTRDVGKLTIVRFDEALRETGRLDLTAPDFQGFTHPAVSPDGSTIAIPSGSTILLVDIATMTVRDPDPSTPDVEIIQTSFTDRVRAVSFFDGGGGQIGLLAVSRFGGKAEAIRITSAGITNIVFSEPLNTRGNAAALAPDGRVFIGFDAGLRVFNPATDTMTSTAHTGGASGILFVNGQLRVIKASRTAIDVANPATGGITVTNNILFQAIGHWLAFTTR
jgi:hypothetical protein